MRTRAYGTAPPGISYPKLQLLHRALRSTERDGNVPDAAPVHEPHVNHLALRVRQTVDELKQVHALFEIAMLAFVRHIGRRVVCVAPLAPPVIEEALGIADRLARARCSIDAEAVEPPLSSGHPQVRLTAAARRMN